MVTATALAIMGATFAASTGTIATASPESIAAGLHSTFAAAEMFILFALILAFAANLSKMVIESMAQCESLV